jgi:putative flippase GtrA
VGSCAAPTSIRRWCRFNLVGLAGFVLQLILLAALTRLTAWPLGACVAVAVMLTVSHNFVWHTRYTWRPPGGAARANVGGADAPPHDGARRGLGRGLRQWAAFNLSNGLISLACNVLVTSGVAALGAPVLAANLTAVAVASLANFVVADRLVFRR